MTGVELDPDPTPTTTPWQEYLAAAQTLDAVRRTMADESVAATHAISTARAELARARTRLGAQRYRLVSEAVQVGVPVPALDPTPADQEWARAAVAGATLAEALAALQQGHGLIDVTDAHLSGAPPPPHSPAAASRPPVPPWLVVAAGAGATTVLLLCGLALVVGLVLE